MPNDLTLLDATKPDGDTETVSVLDDYLKETRLALKDWAGIEHNLQGRHKFPHGPRSNRPISNLDDGVLYFNQQDRRVELYDSTLAKWLTTVFTIGRDIVSAKGDLLVLKQFVLTGGSTFNVANGSRTITATGSIFTTELKPGDSVTLDVSGTPQTFIVEGITSNLEFISTVAAVATITNKDARALSLVRLPVGADGTILAAKSSDAVGIAYTNPSQTGFREFGFRVVTANSVTFYSRIKVDAGYGLQIENKGIVYKRTSDLTLTLPTHLRPAVVLSGGSTFGTANTSAIVTATGSLFLTELFPGDTVIVDPAGGTPQKFTVRTIQSNTQFTAVQDATVTLNGKSGQRSGNTSVARVPDAIYHVYIPPADSWTGAYIDSCSPQGGYHPRNTNDRHAGPQFYNNTSNALVTTGLGAAQEGWHWEDGWQTITLVGSKSGTDYTTTSAGTYAAVDDVSFRRPIWLPDTASFDGGVVECRIYASLKNSVAGNTTKIAFSPVATPNADVFVMSSKGGTIFAGGVSAQKAEGTSVTGSSGATGGRSTQYWGLFFQTVGSGTATISNQATDISTLAAGQGQGFVIIVLRFKTP